jgi:hypothetical protein
MKPACPRLATLLALSFLISVSTRAAECDSVHINMHPQPSRVRDRVIDLQVQATGSEPKAYRWNREGVAIAGATNARLVITNATPDQSGHYSVTISNCAGEVTSSSAYVGVADPAYVLAGLTNHVWKYNSSGADLGTAWKETNYDDSTWPVGQGVFALEDNRRQPIDSPAHQHGSFAHWHEW